MRGVYETVYQKIIEESSRERFEGSHCHRIVPGYLGGEYVEDNTIYLTQRQHSLIHWLRWKLWKRSEDKRAYKMIGSGPSGLSHEDRREHGKMCAAKGIGMFSDEIRKNSQEKGRASQRKEYEEKGNKQNFYYWSTEEGRKERASKGGKTTFEKKSNQVWLKQMGSFRDREHALKSGMKGGKKPVTNGITTKKLKTEEEVENFLKENPEWKRGQHWTNKGITR